MARRKPKPGFDLPSAAPGETGWVSKSDAPARVAPRKTARRKANATDGTAMTGNSEGIVERYARYSAAAALVPVPLFDVAAIGTLQYAMVRELAGDYGVDFDRGRARTFITALAGGVLPTALGPGVALNLAYRIPGIGWLAGALTLPALAGAATLAIGRVFAQHFASGGTFNDFDPAAKRERLAQQFAAAKAR